MRRLVPAGELLGLLLVGAAALDGFRVDQPDEWYNPMVSHHGKHAILGAGIGVMAYGIAELSTESRWIRYGAALTAGTVIGFGYEAFHASSTTYNDPVDALWVVAGSAAGAGLLDLTTTLSAGVEPICAGGHRGAALVVAVRW